MRSIGMQNSREENRHHQLLEVGRPRITSSFVQVWTLPQCIQVSCCLFSLSVAQRSSSIVCPVSVSFDVVGQRTSKLLRVGPVFGFGRRGGSNKNLVAIN